jgi:enoyl-CoA hydratase/carnithine racemase
MSEVRQQIDGAVGRITLNRPDRMNAISVGLARQLHDAITDLGNNKDLSCIVIRGAGGNFCAGGDFEEVQLLRARGPEALRTLFTTFKAACEAIEHVEIPVVAAVEGVAMAGGFELMQAVDIAVVSETARIADNHINFGMIPGGGSTARLPRIVGRQEALGLLLSGDRLSGVEAVDRGLAYRAFPAADFEASLEGFVTRLAGRDRSALIEIKHLVTSGAALPLTAALNAETDAVVSRIAGQAGRDGVTTFHNREVRA